MVRDTELASLKACIKLRLSGVLGAGSSSASGHGTCGFGMLFAGKAGAACNMLSGSGAGQGTKALLSTNLSERPNHWEKSVAAARAGRSAGGLPSCSELFAQHSTDMPVALPIVSASGFCMLSAPASKGARGSGARSATRAKGGSGARSATRAKGGSGARSATRAKGGSGARSATMAKGGRGQGLQQWPRVAQGQGLQQWPRLAQGQGLQQWPRVAGQYGACLPDARPSQPAGHHHHHPPASLENHHPHTGVRQVVASLPGRVLYQVTSVYVHTHLHIVYIYIYMYRIYTFIYVRDANLRRYIYIRMYIYIYIHVLYGGVAVLVAMNGYISSSLDRHIHIYIYIYICICGSYIQTKHVHIYTYMCASAYVSVFLSARPGTHVDNCWM